MQSSLIEFLFQLVSCIFHGQHPSLVIYQRVATWTLSSARHTGLIKI